MQHDTPLSDLDITVPPYVEPDIDVGQVEAIVEGGCASGAYMPAVTYSTAIATMAKHGSAVLAAIADMGDDFGDMFPEPPSWGALCCRLLSQAVELWALDAIDEVEQALEELEELEDEGEA